MLTLVDRINPENLLQQPVGGAVEENDNPVEAFEKEMQRSHQRHGHRHRLADRDRLGNQFADDDMEKGEGRV